LVPFSLFKAIICHPTEVSLLLKFEGRLWESSCISEEDTAPGIREAWVLVSSRLTETGFKLQLNSKRLSTGGSGKETLFSLAIITR